MDKGCSPCCSMIFISSRCMVCRFRLLMTKCLRSAANAAAHVVTVGAVLPVVEKVEMKAEMSVAAKVEVTRAEITKIEIPRIEVMPAAATRHGTRKHEMRKREIQKQETQKHEVAK